MPNTIYNKVTINGTTYMDLSHDTVADASHIRQGYTGHLNDGTQVTGTYSGSSPNLQAKTNISPTTSSQTIQPDSGYDGLSSVQINAMPTGTAGTPTATKGTVSNHQVSVTPSVTNTTGYITGSTKTGTAVTVTASELASGNKEITANGTNIDVVGYSTVSVAVPSSSPNLQAKTNISPTTSSQTITADSGYDGLSSVQINAMPTGTAGTPTATKGTVSNHQVSVTPSVTNTTGYITGSTKTGTAVTVTASELSSGNKEITANGTNIDVVGYSTVSVAVPSSSSGKAGQIVSKVARTSQTTYTDMGFEITVAKAGTYNIYWSGYRSSTSGTSGAQIYKNGSALGSAVTTFNSTYANCQVGQLSNQTLAVNDKITIRARARNTSSYMYIYNLAIIEV